MRHTRVPRRTTTAVLAVAAASLLLPFPPAAMGGNAVAAAPDVVTPDVETPAFPGNGDIADDPAIWVDPAHPERSVVIATNKAERGGGIAVYDLGGRLLQFRPDGALNNVDLRSGMSVGGKPTVVVTASNRTNDSLVFYRLDPATRALHPLNARTVATGFSPYGVCMYRSKSSGSYYAYVTQEAGGRLDQYELFDNRGKVDARKVRTLTLSSQSEGCAADDDMGNLYVGEEDRGIWKYGAEPSRGTGRTVIDTVGGRHLVADVEGMALAYGAGGTGYLVVSSQGNSTYAVYDRRTGAWVESFQIGSAGSIDGTDSTDGLDVTTANLGPAFPNGLLVVHDAVNANGRSSNYKFVDPSQVFGTPSPTPDPPTPPRGTETVTLPVSADSYVTSGSPSRNFGGSSTVNVDGAPATIGYLMFDLSAYADRTVQSVSLRVRVGESGSKGRQNVSLVRGDSWTETGVTYNNRPPLGTVLGTLGPTSENTTYTVPLSAAAVQGEVGTVLSVGLDSASPDGAVLAARQSKHRATLVLELSRR